jgi:hypothetical protein
MEGQGVAGRKADVLPLIEKDKERDGRNTRNTRTCEKK